MLDSRRNSPKIPELKGNESKRTTIILEKPERDSLSP